MKNLLLIFTLFCAFNVTAQCITFDSLTIDSNSKLIGIYRTYGSYEKNLFWSFCIENEEAIRKEIAHLKIGKEVPANYPLNHFEIILIQNNIEKAHWIVDPEMNSVFCDGISYKFKVSNIRKLHSKYPFDYKIEKIVFRSIEEYDSFLVIDKLNKALLYAYPPSMDEFKFEGTFELRFTKTDIFYNFGTVLNYLEPLIEEIVPKNSYSISYVLDDENMNNLNQFKITVKGSKKLFDSLHVEGVKNENWNQMIPEGTFYYKLN